MPTKTEIIYSGPIAGISYGHYKFRPDRLKGRTLVLVPQPENPHDPNAVELKVINGTMAHHVGWIPRKETGRIHLALKAGKKLHAVVDQIIFMEDLAPIPNIFVTSILQISKVLNPPGTVRRILL